MAFTNAITVTRINLSDNRWLQGFLVIFFSMWMSTLIGTTDINNWLLENGLVFVFLAFLIYTYQYYHFSDLSTY